MVGAEGLVLVGLEVEGVAEVVPAVSELVTV